MTTKKIEIVNYTLVDIRLLFESGFPSKLREEYLIIITQNLSIA